MYGITPTDGHRVLTNPETDTSADYPVGVYTEGNAAVTLKDAVVAFDGVAVEAGDLTFTAQYGSTAAEAEDYEWHYSTDGEEWTGGLPVNVGSYTMRLMVKEKLSEGVL